MNYFDQNVTVSDVESYETQFQTKNSMDHLITNPKLLPFILRNMYARQSTADTYFAAQKMRVTFTTISYSLISSIIWRK